MLPGTRAVITAVVAAIGLLAITFALAATFHVAQEVRGGVLQANLAERGRSAMPVNSALRPIPIIAVPERGGAKPEYAESLAPLPVAPVVMAASLVEPVPVVPVTTAALRAEAAPAITPAPPTEPTPPAQVVAAASITEPPAFGAGVPMPAPRPRSADPPMGGPLPERLAAVHVDPPVRDLANEQAARKAAIKKSRYSRLARERRAARRAARLRTQDDSSSVLPKLFANPFDWSFGSNTFGDHSGRRY